jgi:CubicO group peptidase (beta-lactamase class C family)
MDAAMQEYIHSGRLAGVQVLLAQRGQVIHDRCYGYRRLYLRSPLNGDSLYRIFSMTKPITSLAIMMLWEEGHFDLQESVECFLPAFKRLSVFNPNGEPQPLDRPITFHDLLTHTSGLGYGLDPSTPVERLYAQENILRTDEPISHKIERIAAIPLHHQPGARFTYSVATDVLGYLVEVISKQPFDRFLKDRIFDPLEMVDTAFDVPEHKRRRLGPLYTRLKHLPLLDIEITPPQLRPTFLRDAWVNKEQKPRFLSGGGGLVSSMNDYSHFAQMLANRGEFKGKRLISEHTFQTMTSPQLLEHQNPVPGMNLGYGLSVMTDPQKAQLPGTAGSFGGSGAAGTTFWIDPDHELIGILMMQYVSTIPVAIAADFTRIAASYVSMETHHEPA